MRITREGWHRNHGEWELYGRVLSGADVVQDDVPIGYNQLQIVRREIAEGRPGAGTVQLKFRVDTSARPLNGEYLIRLTFTRRDITWMFYQSMKTVSFDLYSRILASLRRRDDALD